MRDKWMQPNGSSDNRRASRTRYLRLFETIRHASLCPELGRKGRSVASFSTGLACLGRRTPTDRCVIAPDSEPQRRRFGACQTADLLVRDRIASRRSLEELREAMR